MIRNFLYLNKKRVKANIFSQKLTYFKKEFGEPSISRVTHLCKKIQYYSFIFYFLMQRTIKISQRFCWRKWKFIANPGHVNISSWVFSFLKKSLLCTWAMTNGKSPQKTSSPRVWACPHGTSSCRFLGRLTVKVKLHFHRTQTVRSSGNAVTPKPC